MYLRHPWCAPPLAQTFPQLAQHVVERGALTHSHDSERSSLCSQRGSLSALLASLCSLPRFRSPRFTNSGTAHGRSATRSLRCGHGRCTRREASRRGHLSHADRGQGRVRALENAAHRCSPRVPSTDGARRTARSAICALGSSAAAHEGGRDLRSSRYERHTRGHTGREKEASALRRRDAADGAKAAGSGVSRCASRAAATSDGQGGVPTCPKRALGSVVSN